MRISFIGGGNLATALIGGLLARHPDAGALRVVEPDAGQRARLAQRFGVGVFEAACAEALDVDVLVLAVKPQQMRDAARAVAPWLGGRLVISVAAGIRSADLSRWLGGHVRIVRTMPNTPALIGRGITGLHAPGTIASADRDAAQAILSAVGETLWVEDEAQLDAVTAMSGSGPAYVFYFIEAMQRAGVALGLSEAQARRLTLATFTGASQLAAASEEPASVLRERVTSKGGTTAAALAVLGERGVDGDIVDAVAAACRRSAELGDAFGQD